MTKEEWKGVAVVVALKGFYFSALFWKPSFDLWMALQDSWALLPEEAQWGLPLALLAWRTRKAWLAKLSGWLEKLLNRPGSISGNVPTISASY